MKTSYHERDYTCGQAILTLRNKIGLTQERLGSLLGVSARAVAGWEGGSNYPKAKHLKALIELAVQQQAFPKDTAAEEIRRLWKVAHQKVLLDEDWLSALLSQQNCQPSDVEPQAVEVTRSSAPPPLPNRETEPDREIQRTADPSGQAVGAAASPCPPPDENKNVESMASPCPPSGGNENIGALACSCPPSSGSANVGAAASPCPANGGRADLWQEAPSHNEAPDKGRRDRACPRPYPPLHETRQLRKRLLLSLIPLVILTIIASAGTLFFQTSNSAATQENKTQTYPGYLPGKGTFGLFDPLSQDRGRQWRSNGGTCQFIAGAYHVSKPRLDGYYALCGPDGMFSNFAFEVQLTITQGDCGGMMFRDEGNDHFYNFVLCEDGGYWETKFVDNQSSDAILLCTGRSSAIHTDLGQQNTVAVVASGSTMTFYVNSQQIARAQDDSYTSGLISLIADPVFNHITEVVYRNARLWTL